MDKIIIGSEEWCHLPQLGIPAIKVRVDSGARTSALHAFNIKSFKRGGIPWVSFHVHPLQRSRAVSLHCEAPIVDRRMVKNTSGAREKRYVIRVPMRMGEHIWEIELTLTNRDSMGYRMLLGREAMANRILVDPSASMSLGRYSESELVEMYGMQRKAKTGLKIALLASNPELYSNQRIMEAGTERGHEMIFLGVKDC